MRLLGVRQLEVGLVQEDQAVQVRDRMEVVELLAILSVLSVSVWTGVHTGWCATASASWRRCCTTTLVREFPSIVRR